jgi:hypothetical protein
LLLAVLFLGALRATSLPLSVEVPDELWPQWLWLVAASSLPAGIEVIRFLPGTAPPGDHATLAYGQEGRIVAYVPLVPVAKLWDEREIATRSDVTEGKVRLLPLSAVSLPDVALPSMGFSLTSLDIRCIKKLRSGSRAGTGGCRSGSKEWESLRTLVLL